MVPDVRFASSIDKAIAIAAQPGVIFTSFGDMLRVSGSHKSLADAKAEGADVRMVYSPFDAVKIAAAYPLRQVVFFAVGFETTAPANAMAVWQAHRMGLENFSVLVAHVLVPPAMEAILVSPNCRIQGFRRLATFARLRDLATTRRSPQSIACRLWVTDGGGDRILHMISGEQLPRIC